MATKITGFETLASFNIFLLRLRNMHLFNFIADWTNQTLDAHDLLSSRINLFLQNVRNAVNFDCIKRLNIM
jgi:hypothetical protein